VASSDTVTDPRKPEAAVELPNFLVAKPHPSEPHSTQPNKAQSESIPELSKIVFNDATKLPPPTEPPPESLSQDARDSFVQIQLQQIVDRLSRLEKLVRPTKAPPPPPSLETIEATLLGDVARLEHGELTNEEHAILRDRLSNLASELQKRAIRMFSLARRVRGG